MSAPAAITWAEMLAWSQLRGLELQPWQAVTLGRLDLLWRATWRDTQAHT